jgi:hypothetical protein
MKISAAPGLQTMKLGNSGQDYKILQKFISDQAELMWNTACSEKFRRDFMISCCIF